MLIEVFTNNIKRHEGVLTFTILSFIQITSSFFKVSNVAISRYLFFIFSFYLSWAVVSVLNLWNKLRLQTKSGERKYLPTANRGRLFFSQVFVCSQGGLPSGGGRCGSEGVWVLGGMAGVIHGKGGIDTYSLLRLKCQCTTCRVPNYTVSRLQRALSCIKKCL